MVEAWAITIVAYVVNFLLYGHLSEDVSSSEGYAGNIKYIKKKTGL